KINRSGREDELGGNGAARPGGLTGPPSGAGRRDGVAQGRGARRGPGAVGRPGEAGLARLTGVYYDTRGPAGAEPQSSCTSGADSTRPPRQPERGHKDTSSADAGTEPENGRGVPERRGRGRSRRLPGRFPARLRGTVRDPEQELPRQDQVPI